MKVLGLILLFAMALLIAPAASAGPAAETRALYERFFTAQNARDLDAVRAILLDGPNFLWVSDGMSVWGREAMLKRMALFQEAEVWRVEPDLDHAVAVETGRDSAYLHLPLALTIGPATAPETVRFLVSVLCVETRAGWRIAALFTATAKEG